MAIGVCYLGEGGCPDWLNAAIYLKQAFCTSAHLLVQREQAGPLLTRIMTMGYGGNVLLRTDQHRQLLTELDSVASHLGQIPQLDELIVVVRRALQDARAIVFWGDMYPELDKELRHCMPVPTCASCGARPKSPFWDICDCGYVRESRGT